MISFGAPSSKALERFRRRQDGAAWSYACTGATSGPAPAGFVFDEYAVRLGDGAECFDRACQALREWRMFPAHLAEIASPRPEIEAGNIAVVLIRIGPLTTINACRMVYTIDEREPTRRFGFAYGTLADHFECGEERFCVTQRADDSVWYELEAFSRPNRWFARLGYPFVRQGQRRFARASLQAMVHAVQLPAVATLHEARKE